MLTEEKIGEINNPLCRYNMACRYCVTDKIPQLFQEQLESYKSGFSSEEVDDDGRPATNNRKYVRNELLNAMNSEDPVLSFWIDKKSGEFKKHDNAVEGFNKAVEFKWSKVTEEYNEAVDLLLEAGANPNIQNDKGRTPLHYTDVLASAASLLKGKANPNIQDNRGETPLHYAASIGHADYVNLLIEKKANSNIQDKKGATPLQIAIDNHHYYIEECFLTNDQKSLSAELYRMLDECFGAYEDHSGYAADFIKNLKEFLGKHENSEDLKGYFERSGGLMRPEVISESNNKWTEREELRRTSDPRREVSR
nr:unnamed protein product [Callosobruchus chinensis]